MKPGLSRKNNFSVLFGLLTKRDFRKVFSYRSRGAEEPGWSEGNLKNGKVEQDKKKREREREREKERERERFLI